MLRNRKRIADFSIAFILALGFAGLIMLAFFWLAMLQQTTRQGVQTTSFLSKEGEIVIADIGPRSQEYRDLDGNVLTGTENYSDRFFNFYNYSGAIPLRIGPRHWSQRIARFKVGVTSWYLIRAATGADAFFVGYEKNVGRKGYFGANGFQTSRPTGDELIQISSGSRSAFFSDQWPYSDPGRTYASHTVWFPTPEGLVEVDLRERTIKPIANIENAIARGAPQGSASQTGSALMSAERIYLLDEEGKQVLSIPHAADHDAWSVTVYPELEDQIIVATAYYKTNDWSQKYYWYEKGGENKLLRTESVELGSRVDLSALEYLAGMVSSPLAAFYLPTFWGIASASLLPCLLAVFVWRNEGSVQASISWALFVFLFGLSGFLGYWFHRKRKETLLSCLKCNATIPKFRLDCLRCSESLPLPPRIGTEILA